MSLPSNSSSFADRVFHFAKMYFALAISCLAIMPMVLGEKLNERMTADQLAKIIQSTQNLASTSDYEIVQFHVPRITKRDSKFLQPLKVRIFGNDIRLFLKPNKGILAGKKTPVYKANINPKSKKVVYTEIPNAMKNIGKFLEDPAKKASMLVTTDSKGQYSMNGFIGSMNLIVRSLPESLYGFMQNRSSHDSRITRSAYHVVFKREEKRSKRSHKSIELDKQSQRQAVTKHSSIPEVVYPEIMLVIDYHMFALTGNNIEKALIYGLVFWNGVDLLYRSFEAPKFSFNIVRIIIAETPEATPYISGNMYDNEMIAALDAHNDVQKYYFSILDKFPGESYDAVVTMTGLEMTSGDGDNDVLGIAPWGGACIVDETKKFVRSTIILTDDGAFHGISTAAHEFAHLLGATHDDSSECKSTDGYLMTEDDTITENSHDFSVCTAAEITRFFGLNKGTCLYTLPKTTDPLPRGLLPGHLIDRDHQCALLSRGKSCYTGSAKQLRCTAIYCLEPNERNPECFDNKSYSPPDGAFCDKGKICLHGKCVAL